MYVPHDAPDILLLECNAERSRTHVIVDLFWLLKMELEA